MAWLEPVIVATRPNPPQRADALWLPAPIGAWHGAERVGAARGRRMEVLPVIVGPLKLKAQLFCGDEGAIGPGKANLLEAVGMHGSISAAGRALGMSYRRTWLLVDAMNRCWTERLVETTLGGGPGRGARLTLLGIRVLEEYRSMERRLAEAAAPSIETLSALLRAAPLPAQSTKPPES